MTQPRLGGMFHDNTLLQGASMFPTLLPLVHCRGFRGFFLTTEKPVLPYGQQGSGPLRKC